MGAAPRQKVKRRWTWGRRLGVLLPLLAAAAIVSYFLVPEVLSRAGRLLVSEVEPQPSDAIVILGGGGIDRAREAAELFRAGFAPRVLLTREEIASSDSELRDLGIELVPPRENDLRILRGLGVPDEAIVHLDSVSTETMDELADIRDFAFARGWRRLIVVTSNFHTRRSGLIARVVFPDGWTIGVVGSRYSDFEAARWWRETRDIRTFLIEFQKLVVYEIYLRPQLWF